MAINVLQHQNVILQNSSNNQITFNSTFTPSDDKEIYIVAKLLKDSTAVAFDTVFSKFEASTINPIGLNEVTAQPIAGATELVLAGFKSTGYSEDLIVTSSFTFDTLDKVEGDFDLELSIFSKEVVTETPADTSNNDGGETA